MILNKQIMNLKFNCWITVVPTIMCRLSDPFFPEFFFHRGFVEDFYSQYL